MKRRLILFFLLSSFLLSYGQSDIEQKFPTYSPVGSLSLRTNAVSWLMLLPNIGLEYKTSDRLGLLVDVGWAHWGLNSPDKYWRMWHVSPQMRYYIGESKCNYIGGQYALGQYNLTGRQGKYMGGGLTLGHQFYAGTNLMVDLGVSVGYLHLYDKEKYHRVDGVDYRRSDKASNGYWGLTGLSMTFVWKID